MNTYYKSASHGKDSIFAWLICLCASSFSFLETIRSNIFNSLAQGIMKYYNIDAFQLSKLSALYLLATILFIFPAAMLLDKCSAKKVLIISLCINIFASFLFYFTHSFFMAKLSLFLAGIGTSSSFLCAMKFISQWLSASKIALGSGLLVAYGMVGGLIAQGPTTYFVEKFAWQYTILLLGIAELFLLILVWIFVKELTAKNPLDCKFVNPKAWLLDFCQHIKASITSKQNWLSGIYTSFLNFPINLLGALWGISYLVQAHGLDQKYAANIVSMLFVGIIFGSPFMGWFSNKIKSRRYAMLLGAAISIIVIVLIMHLQYFPTKLAFLFFLALGFCAGSQMLGYAVVAESNPSTIAATSVSVASFLVISGGTFFQPLFGWLMKLGWDGKIIDGVPFYSLVNYKHALMILPIAFIIAFIIVFFIKESYKNSAENSRH